MMVEKLHYETFAKTAFEHVRKQIEGHIHQSRFGQKLLCMIPGVPPETAVVFADSLLDYCADKSRLVSL